MFVPGITSFTKIEKSFPTKNQIILYEPHLTLSKTNPGFNMFLQYEAFENTVTKVETAGNEQFLLFPQCFISLLKEVSSNLEFSSAYFLSLEESEICCLRKA